MSVVNCTAGPPTATMPVSLTSNRAPFGRTSAVIPRTASISHFRPSGPVSTKSGPSKYGLAGLYGCPVSRS